MGPNVRTSETSTATRCLPRHQVYIGTRGGYEMNEETVTVDVQDMRWAVAGGDRSAAAGTKV